MIFEHRFVDLPKLDEDYSSGKRYYVTPEGNSYPSVTTILSSIQKSDGLKAWQRRVGKEEAEHISKVTAARGENVHKICEDYLMNRPMKGYMPDTLGIFAKMKLSLNQINPVYAIETQLYSDRYKFAGRCDVIGDYQSIPSIIDNKTYNTEIERTPEKFDTYGMQLGAYAIAFEERTGMVIDQGVLIFGSNDYGNRTFKLKLPKYKKNFLQVLENYAIM